MTTHAILGLALLAGTAVNFILARQPFRAADASNVATFLAVGALAALARAGRLLLLGDSALIRALALALGAAEAVLTAWLLAGCVYAVSQTPAWRHESISEATLVWTAASGVIAVFLLLGGSSAAACGVILIAMSGLFAAHPIFAVLGRRDARSIIDALTQLGHSAAGALVGAGLLGLL